MITRTGTQILVAIIAHGKSASNVEYIPVDDSIRDAYNVLVNLNTEYQDKYSGEFGETEPPASLTAAMVSASIDLLETLNYERSDQMPPR